MDTTSPISKHIANNLLEINAIKLNLEEPFTWASGWKSPIYCDNRLSLSFPDVRRRITEGLAGIVSKEFGDAEVVAGVATAGIPQGVLVSEVLNLPFIYVRSKPKGHGLSNQIEGNIVKGAKTVVIEDLISTGGSSIAAIEALRNAGMNVLGMVSIFTYGFKEAEKNLSEKAIPFYTLSNYEVLLEVALERKYIRSEELQKLRNWRKNPAGWE